MPENEKVVQAVNEDDDFFKDLLEEPKEAPELTEEEQRLKNKNAEEARKRREAEAKQPKQPEAPVAEAKPVEPSKKPDEVKPEEAKPQPTTEEPAPDQKAQQVNKLGEQLVKFKAKHPNVDLAQLDGDKSFKRFIDGKLLGKKDFTALYEEYVTFKAEITGQDNQQIIQNYQRKAQSGTGSPTTTANAAADVFSEDELKRIAQRLPFMSPKEAKQIEQKLTRSVSYYDNKK